jgi:translation initiation factor 3 subunit C
MTPQERRWKWVKKSALPKDLVELMDKLTKDKKKKKDTTIKKVVTESGAVITEA